MIVKVFLTCFFNILLLSICQGQQNKMEGDLMVIVRVDNDFVTYTDTVSPREKLPENIKTYILKNLGATGFKFDLIFKLTASKEIFLYVVKGTQQSQVLYYFFAYDHISKAISPKPEIINGKWMENNEEGFDKKFKLLKGKQLSFANVLYQNNIEFSIKERVHNGNYYNAVLSKYYYIKKNLELCRIFCLEIVSVSPFENCSIERSIKNGNCIQVELLCEGVKKLIGRVYFKIADNNITVVKKRALVPEYKDLLITSSGEMEKYFLKNGYHFRY